MVKKKLLTESIHPNQWSAKSVGPGAGGDHLLEFLEIFLGRGLPLLC